LGTGDNFFNRSEGTLTVSSITIVSNAQLSTLILGALKTHICVDALVIFDLCLKAKFTLK